MEKHFSDKKYYVLGRRTQIGKSCQQCRTLFTPKIGRHRHTKNMSAATSGARPNKNRQQYIESTLSLDIPTKPFYALESSLLK